MRIDTLDDLKALLAKIKADYDSELEKISDTLHRDIILPFCKKYKVTFASGNGGYSFYENSSLKNPNHFSMGNVYDSAKDFEDSVNADKEDEVKSPRFNDSVIEDSKAVFEFLFEEFMDDSFNIGSYTKDVTDKDLGD